MQTPSPYEKLVSKFRDNTATQQELEVFFNLLNEGKLDHFIDAAMLQQLEQEQAPVVSAHRVRFLKTAWLRYAAAIIILFGVGTYLYKNINRQREKPAVTQVNPVPVQNDVAPGSNKATLTLADGKKINLDNASNGTIAKEGNTAIDKTEDGQIIYRASSTGLPLTTAMNTMSTPRGGQYQLVLPDGSRVWLNAESSITYPTAFTGTERNVSITGEAYFEVAKDKTKPFKVHTRTDVIEVLGTHFNVNAYADEAGVKTSLLEGSVRVGAGEDPARNAQHPGASTILQPGQASVNGRVTTTDTETDVAWKNGLFNFDGADLPTVMRQLARWYDIEVEYKDTPKAYRFKGKIQRNLTLSQVLNILGEVEVKFNIQGRKLTVTP